MISGRIQDLNGWYNGCATWPVVRFTKLDTFLLLFADVALWKCQLHYSAAKYGKKGIQG